MKKLLMGLFWFVIAWTTLFTSLTSANGIGDTFWTVWTTTSAGDTTTATANNDVNYLIGNLDFLGSTLVKRSFEFFLIYPSCFSTKGVAQQTVFYNPKICYPQGWKKSDSDKTIQVSWGKINIQDMMDGKFEVANSAPLLVITLFFSLGILATLFFMKYTSEGGNSWGGEWWEGGSGSWGNVVVGSWMLKGRVGWWLLEKILWKDDIKDWEEKKNSLSTWLYIIAFFLFLFFGSLLLSNGINGKVRTAFDQSYSGLWVLYWVWFIYTISFIAFIAIVLVLARFSLLSFIRMDLDKTEETSLPNKIWKLIAIGIWMIGWSYVIISVFITIIATVLKV